MSLGQERESLKHHSGIGQNGRHDHVSSFAFFAVHFPHEDDTLAIV